MTGLLPDFTFHCLLCGRTGPVDGPRHCDGCGAPYVLRPARYPDTGLFDRMPASLWDFRALLPVPAQLDPISLGEVASASAVAALPRLPGLDKETRVCCIVSGSGLKDLGALARAVASVPVIAAALAALETVPALARRDQGRRPHRTRTQGVSR